MTLTTFSLINLQGRPLSLCCRKDRYRGRSPKPTIIIIISHKQVSVAHNSPTMVKSVACSDVPPVTPFLATQEYSPLSLVENVWMLSTPLSGWPDVTVSPLRSHVNRAGGSESAVQVSRTACPTPTFPAPTHSFGTDLVSTGVSGPSGLVTRRGHHDQHHRVQQMKFFYQNKIQAQVYNSSAQMICSVLFCQRVCLSHSGEPSLIMSAYYADNEGATNGFVFFN